MVDDVILNKVNTIERCVQRAREEYQENPDTFNENFTRQDAAILNIQRCCETCLDLGHYLVRKANLGVPQSSRDVFSILAANGVIPDALSDSLQKMVGFRNMAVHDYKSLKLPIVVSIITEKLDDFLQFTRAIIAPDQS